MKRQIPRKTALVLCDITSIGMFIAAIAFFCTENIIGGIIITLGAIFFAIPQLIIFFQKKSQSKKNFRHSTSIGVPYLTPQKIYISYKPIDKSMIIKYNLGNQEEIAQICNLILEAVNHYNAHNSVSVPPREVIEMAFHRYHNEFSAISKDNIHNIHLGIIGIATTCCIILSDEPYQLMRECKDLELKVGDIPPSELKKDFQEIMDDIYIDIYMNQVMRENNDDVESLNAKLPLINGADLIDECLKRFKAKYNLQTDDFFVLKEAYGKHI